MAGKPARREVHNAALPGSALSSLVPPKAAPTASPAKSSDPSDVPEVSDVSRPVERAAAPQRSKAPARRDPTKVDAELLQQMRDFTAFIRGKGRPMAELGELLDEALSEYLDRKRRELNEGERFPHIGRLR